MQTATATVNGSTYELAGGFWVHRPDPGAPPAWMDGYRVTDPSTIEALNAAAGCTGGLGRSRPLTDTERANDNGWAGSACGACGWVTECAVCPQCGNDRDC